MAAASFSLALALFSLTHFPAVLAHANITSPAIRSPGPAFKATCGQTSFDTVSKDPTGHIEEQEPVNTGCELTLCRGMLLADQPSTDVLTVQPSQAMEMFVDCTIPHGGPANVSLVDTTVGGAGQIIGSFLKTFADFCPTTGPTPVDQSNLQYTLPDVQTVGNSCQSPGECVVQLFWATPDFSQNYYYCVDVVMEAEQPTTVGATTSKAGSLDTGVLADPATTPGTSSKMVTSVVVAPTGITVAANVGSSGRRRARILWF